MSFLFIIPLIALVLASAFAHSPPMTMDIAAAAAQSPFTLDNSNHVPVLLGVMSRCSDTILCESVFDDVLQHTWDIVDITLSFVGKCVSPSPYPAPLVRRTSNT